MINKIEEFENKEYDEKTNEYMNQIKIFLNQKGENITIEEI